MIEFDGQGDFSSTATTKSNETSRCSSSEEGRKILQNRGQKINIFIYRQSSTETYGWDEKQFVFQNIQGKSKRLVNRNQQMGNQKYILFIT